MQVLVFLADRQDEVLSREEIHESVWEGTIVSDEVLTNAIRELRKSLGDDAKEPQFIQTVPKKGYRLIAPVVVEDGSHSRPSRISPYQWAFLGAAALIALASSGFYLLETIGPRSAPPVVRPFTSHLDHEREPDLSPDGEYLVFAWDKEEQYDIYIQLIDGGAPLRLTSDHRDEYSPKWSPDGHEIAFYRKDDDETCEVIVIPTLGGAEKRLGTIAQCRIGMPIWDFGLDWSTDRRWLAVMDRESDDERTGVFLLSTETGEKTRLTHPPKDSTLWDWQPAFSPDGSTVAYLRGWGLSGYEIRLHFLDGGDQSLHRAEGLIYDIDWTPDGNELVFSTEWQSRLSFHRLPISGGEPIPLGFGEYADKLSISGDRLVYSTYQIPNCEIWRFDGPAATEPNPPTKVIRSTRMEWLPRYSPDGTKIAISSRRLGAPSIWVCSTTEDQCERVSEESGFDAKWSPEGDRLVFTGVEWDLFIVDINGGFTRRLLEDDYLDATPSWSGDGNWIYFTSDRTGVRQIWKMPAEGGEPVQLTHEGAGSPRESHDGRFVYYMKPLGKFERMAGNPHHVWSVPVDGGEEQPVFEEMEIVAGGNITLWHESFVFLDRDEETGDRIFQFDIPTGKLEEIAYLGHGGSYCLGCNVSPDGRWILLAKRDERQTADIFVVDNFY